MSIRKSLNLLRSQLEEIKSRGGEPVFVLAQDALRQVGAIEAALSPSLLPVIPDVLITSKMVVALRDKTDMPLMECKRALVESHGDESGAVELLRTRFRNQAAAATPDFLVPLYRWLARAKFDNPNDESRAAVFASRILAAARPDLSRSNTQEASPPSAPREH